MTQEEYKARRAEAAPMRRRRAVKAICKGLWDTGKMGAELALLGAGLLIFSGFFK